MVRKRYHRRSTSILIYPVLNGSWAMYDYEGYSAKTSPGIFAFSVVSLTQQNAIRTGSHVLGYHTHSPKKQKISYTVYEQGKVPLK